LHALFLRQLAAPGDVLELLLQMQTSIALTLTYGVELLLERLTSLALRVGLMLEHLAYSVELLLHVLLERLTSLALSVGLMLEHLAYSVELLLERLARLALSVGLVRERLTYGVENEMWLELVLLSVLLEQRQTERLELGQRFNCASATRSLDSCLVVEGGSGRRRRPRWKLHEWRRKRRKAISVGIG